MPVPERATPSRRRVFSVFNLVAPLILALIFFLLNETVFMERLENMTLDTRIRMRAESQPLPDERVLLIAIEESSEERLGRFPWSRDVYAQFIQTTQLSNPAVYTFDIFFPTYTGTETDDIPDSLASRADLLFAQACENTEIPTIMGVMQIKPEDADRGSGRELEKGMRLGWPAPLDISNSNLKASERVDMSYPELLRVSNSGLVNAEPHADGIVRKLPLVALVRSPDGDQIVPSLSLQALIQYWKLDPAQHLRIVPGDAVYIDSPTVQRRIPINHEGEYAVNWRHGLESYIERSQAVPFFAMLRGYFLLHSEGTREPGLPEIEDRILVFGQTAIGMADMAESPFAPRSPLPIVHMNLIDNILNEDYLRLPSAWLTWGGFLVLAYLTLIPTARLGFWLKSIIPVAVLALYLPVCWFAFMSGNLHLEIVAPGMAFFILHVGAVGRQVLEERQAKEEMRRTFSAYVAPGIIDSIYENPDKLQLGGAKKDVAILFTDIRSFTTMTENMDSEVLVAQLNEYFEQMVDGIMSHQGTLHKFIGDAIMAVWGDIKYAGPTVDAGQALSASLAMRKSLTLLNQRWVTEGRPEFHMGVGLNYGQVVVGNIGAPQRMEFTVIGDAVNLAARLESLNKQFGTEILVGDSIYNLTHERFIFRFAGRVQVKGKGVSVPIYEALCEVGREADSPYDLKWIQLYEEAYARFDERRYDVAARLFEACLNDYPTDTLSTMMLDTSRHFIDSPPPEDWDGSFEMTSK